jgi:hypothetical protein
MAAVEVGGNGRFWRRQPHYICAHPVQFVKGGFGYYQTDYHQHCFLVQMFVAKSQGLRLTFFGRLGHKMCS